MTIREDYNYIHLPKTEQNFINNVFFQISCLVDIMNEKDYITARDRLSDIADEFEDLKRFLNQ